MTFKDKHLIKKYISNKGYVETTFDESVRLKKSYKFYDYGRNSHFTFIDEEGLDISITICRFASICFDRIEDVIKIIK